MNGVREKYDQADCGASGIAGIEAGWIFASVAERLYYEWKKTREERERRARDYAERVRRVFEESGGVVPESAGVHVESGTRDRFT